jgi:hypothetical protein
MATITSKIINGHSYFYLRECQRVDGKPRIVRQKYLGSADRVAEILDKATGTGAGREPRHGVTIDGEEAIRRRFDALRGCLDERLRRLVAAAEARSIGRGGASLVSRATGVSLQAIKMGGVELRRQQRPTAVRLPLRLRRGGGGRKRRSDTDPALLKQLDRLVDPATRGDPESPLRWTSKSVRHLAKALGQAGHVVSHRLVADLLRELGYSLQANRKTREGKQHPDRNAQFEYINAAVKTQLGRGWPAVSVDAKKKELVGNFKNGGREYEKMGKPVDVDVYDFIIKHPDFGRVTPYGLYDMGANIGWVNVGTDHDTSTFAVESIRRWWTDMGSKMYPDARRLLITADSGGSNGSRVRLWKVELQRLANELGFPITVHHLPPGTSKWNKIEHRLFSAISRNWRGRPLVSHEVVVNLIAGTTTETGLSVRSRLDKQKYPTGVKIHKKEMAKLGLQPHDFHGEWNYTINPV